MDPTIKTLRIENVKRAISNIKNSQEPIPSFRARELCTNVSMIVSDFQYDKIDKVQSWIQIYDIQGHMSILMDTIVNPFHLDSTESDIFSSELKTITDFIEYARECIN